jgi:2-succinyl-5-enolpyruvyl-6-hydroxy-3-cyclohexene-1-carboxylate synthase
VHLDDRLTAAMVLPIDQTLASDGPLPKRGLIIVGDPIDGECREAAADLADACGWPLLTEPSGLPDLDSDALIAHGPLLLADERFAASHVPELVITVGRVGLSRSMMRLIAAADRHVVVDPRPATRWADALRTSNRVLSAVPEPPEEYEHDPQWLADWIAAAELADDAVSSLLDHDAQVTGPAVARLLMAQADAAGVVLVSASWPVRHVEAYALPQTQMPLVVGNRGASGIDGLVSTAIGVAVAHQRLGGSTGYALLGDLAFLYDTNGLMLGEGEVPPDLIVVVIDNDGGGIFSSLEQGHERFASDFQRVFGTPHGRDLVAVAQAYGVPARRVTTNREFIAAVDDCVQLGGLQVIVANTGSREDEAALVVQLQAAVSAALVDLPETP